MYTADYSATLQPVQGLRAYCMPRQQDSRLMWGHSGPEKVPNVALPAHEHHIRLWKMLQSADIPQQTDRTSVLTVQRQVTVCRQRNALLPLPLCPPRRPSVTSLPCTHVTVEQWVAGHWAGADSGAAAGTAAATACPAGCSCLCHQGLSCCRQCRGQVARGEPAKGLRHLQVAGA